MLQHKRRRSETITMSAVYYVHCDTKTHGDAHAKTRNQRQRRERRAPLQGRATTLNVCCNAHFSGRGDGTAKTWESLWNNYSTWPIAMCIKSVSAKRCKKVAILVYRREQHLKSAKRLLSWYIGGSNMYVYIYSRHYIYTLYRYYLYTYKRGPV